MGTTSSKGQRAARDPIGERLPFDQFEDERPDRQPESADTELVETVDRRDVRMIERCQDLRFAFEPRQPLRIDANASGRIFSATSRCRRVSRAR